MSMARRRVLVTGATRGLGQALAEHWLATGDEVIGCGRGPSPIDHERYTHYACDVTDAAAVSHLFGELKQQAPHLDVLITPRRVEMPASSIDCITCSWSRLSGSRTQ